MSKMIWKTCQVCHEEYLCDETEEDDPAICPECELQQALDDQQQKFWQGYDNARC